MRVLFLSTGLGYGGAETQLLNLCEALAQKGIKSIVISMVDDELGLLHRFEAKGIVVETLGMKRGKLSIVALFRYLKILKEFNPDVIHSHMIHANIFARLFRFFHKAPLVNTAHNVYEGGQLLEALLRATNSLCDSFTQVSEEGLKRYSEINLLPNGSGMVMKNCVHIPTAIEPANIRDSFGIRKDAFLFINVGRLESVKNHMLLLDAISEQENAYCLIVGDGYLRNDIDRRITELRLEKRVFLLGKRDDIYSLMAAADCFIMTSNYEGFPISILEAISCSLPIISTNVGDIHKVVDSDNGVLIDSGDLISLKSAIEKIVLSSPMQISEMRKKSKERSLAYSSEVIADEWLSEYTKVITLG
ncbi:glycosyltransferase [Aeromonas hydrophila]|uniref:glycosyltransferase n=1 Tax=Aeromonas hydrophila TaxID=644 RepID=UPI00249D9B18|nr:glycosyltransferase [Aeromonas hydrophila]WGY33620.1 glycosyltransferase [Aeromonas hydrophila]HDC4325028.1 glycosyltransferase [Aeromonas hydrophila]